MQQLYESIKMALAALTANKLRAVLTTLGVVIGITFVLLMGWFLAGLGNALDQTLAIMGDDILYIDKFEWANNDWRSQRNRRNLDMPQYYQIRERLHSAELVVPVSQRSVDKVEYGDLQLSGIRMTGTTAEYIEMYGGNLAEGRFFTGSEEQSGSPVAVVGYNVVKNLFDGRDPTGETIRVDGRKYLIVGSMPKRGTMMADFIDNEIYIPLRRFFDQFGGRRSIVVNVKAGGVENLENVRYETIGVLRQVRSIAPGMKDDFGVNSMDQFRKQFDQLRVIVWSVGIVMSGLSFLVGSIGIMNIMFVSVTERTKEIGIRKAIGATRSSILTQFLVEAVVLCLMGSVIAYLFTSLIAWLGSTVMEITFLSPTIPPLQILIAVSVSVLVGVMAGIIPAFRAARMDPVEALRAE